MRVEVVFVRSRQVLMLNKILPDGRYYPRDGLQIPTTNPIKTVSEIIEQLEGYLKLSKDLSANKANKQSKHPGKALNL